MKIALVGTHCNGKSTLVKAIQNKWPMYKSPKKTYREIIKEKNLDINQKGNLESQSAILDALCEQAHANADEKYSISDRCVLDNLAYTLYLVDKGKIDNDEFIVESILRHKDAIKKYDIIFWLPLNKGISLDEINNPLRDTDPVFRIEIDNVFSSIFDLYRQNTGLLFDPKDQPAMIRLDGDLLEKMELISEYIGDHGELFETEKSVLTTMEEEFDKHQLLEQVNIKK